MSMTPKGQRQVIDLLFDVDPARLATATGDVKQDVQDFLENVHEFLRNLHPGTAKELIGARKPGDVGIGQSATTEDLVALAARRIGGS
jgi:hypothetical protein